MTRTITAVYDNEADALRARDELAGNGVSADDVRVVSHNLRGSAVGDVDKSIWESLAEFLIVDADRPLYDESLRRGGYLVTARVDDEASDRVISILDRTSPIDLDERSQQWRTEGWSPEGLGAPASMHGYASGAGPTTESVAQELRAQAERLDDAARDEVVQERVIFTRESTRSGPRIRSYVHERRSP